MRFVTFEHEGHAHAGALAEDKVISLKNAGIGSILSLVEGGPAALDKAKSFASNARATAMIPLASVKLRAPLPQPKKILCMGLNYRDHATEAKLETPPCPVIFAKYSNTVVGPDDEIILPRNSIKPDYEAEFAFVIGKTARHVKAADWREYIFGYMNANDVSARDFQMAVSQWTMGKNFDTFAPMGPYLATADEIKDPHNLSISLTLNGEKVQDSNTRELIFKIPETIEFLSSVMTLEPGDIVLTGTPAGVGFSFKPPKWLTPGAEVIVRIEGLGELRNTCVAEK